MTKLLIPLFDMQKCEKCLTKWIFLNHQSLRIFGSKIWRIQIRHILNPSKNSVKDLENHDWL